VRDDDEFTPESFAKIRELWLYANVKSERHVFTAQFVGKMTRTKFLAAYPSYAKLGPSRQKAYYVFTTKPVDYPSELGSQIVIARVADFGGYSVKVKKTIEQFKQDGEFASLAAYLPKELGNVPCRQLRVCEAAVQMDFFAKLGDSAKQDVPFPQVKNPTFTFIDLFAGIGGFRLAMQLNGGRCVFSSEWNESAQKTYCANYGDTPYGDITKQETKDLIPNGFDILCAGFPCQPFSIAGVSKKNSLGRATGFEDKTQGTLFFDVCKILKLRRPKAFLLENVKNLCSHDKGNTFRVICEALDELDYSIAFKVIDGQNFVPQHRERILIVGFDRKRYGTHVDFEFKIKPVVPKPRMRDILEKDPDSKYTLSDKLWNYLQRYAEKHKAAGNGFGFGLAPLDGVSRTLSARYYKDGSEILIEQRGKNPRRLTPLECARLMGFPSNFKIVVSDCQAYKQFGNSVVMPLMADVGRLIIEKIQELEEHE
jgi:DNA (cytosine-5)-methyltransferase 1